MLLMSVMSVTVLSRQLQGMTEVLVFFIFKENPVHYKPFIEVLEDIRMNRLETLFDF